MTTHDYRLWLVNRQAELRDILAEQKMELRWQAEVRASTRFLERSIVNHETELIETEKSLKELETKG